MKINQPFTMRGRNRHRLAKPELPRFSQTRGTGASFTFVCQKNNMGAGPADLVSKEFVSRRYPGTRVDDQHCHIGKFDGALGLTAHPVFQTAAGRLFKASCIDHTEP